MLRAIKKFLWLPKKDNNKWYWLQTVVVVEKEVIYDVIEYPLFPFSCKSYIEYQETKYEFVGIFDESNAIEIFVPDKDCP